MNRTRLRKVRVIHSFALFTLALLVLALLTASCTRIIHPTEVAEGWHADLLPNVGFAQRTHMTSGWETGTFQIDLGYGWPRSESGAASVTLNVPINFPLWQSFLYGPLLDIYWQFPVGAVNLGSGVALGTIPQLYVQSGRSFNVSGNTTLSLDLALKWVMNYWGQVEGKRSADVAGLSKSAVAPSLLLSIGGKTVRGGLWAEYDWYPGKANFYFCDETCGNTSEHEVQATIYSGLMLMVMF